MTRPRKPKYRVWNATDEWWILQIANNVIIATVWNKQVAYVLCDVLNDLPRLVPHLTQRHIDEKNVTIKLLKEKAKKRGDITK